MRLHEYQSKLRLAEFDLPIPPGRIATSADEAFTIAQQLLGGQAMVKAQAFVNQRADAGAILFAQSPEEASRHAQHLLSMHLDGMTVRKVLVEQAVERQSEIYLSIANDYRAGKPVLFAATREEKQRHREYAAIEHIDLLTGLHEYQITTVINTVNVPRESWDALYQIVRGMYRCFIQSDATQVEISSLALTPGGQFMVLDAQIIVDDNALFRHTHLVSLRDHSAEERSERLARETGINYVSLEGEIACVANGAGLAMTTADMVRICSKGEIEAASLIDIGSEIRPERLVTALHIALLNGGASVVLCHIFTDLLRCEEIARHIVQACTEAQSSRPVIIRLQGVGLTQGYESLHMSELPQLMTALTLREAAQLAISSTRGA